MSNQTIKSLRELDRKAAELRAASQLFIERPTEFNRIGYFRARDSFMRYTETFASVCDANAGYPVRKEDEVIRN